MRLSWESTNFPLTLGLVLAYEKFRKHLVRNRSILALSSILWKNLVFISQFKQYVSRSYIDPWCIDIPKNELHS